MKEAEMNGERSVIMSFLTRRKVLGPLVALAVLALLALSLACGGDDEGNGGDGGAATTPAGDGNGDGNGGDGGETTFDVSMGDNLFDPNELTVPAGAEVTINLTNDGTAIHNMRVAGADNEYNTDDDAVSEEELVNAGDSAVVNWTSPDEAGEVDFQCDFHPSDMIGTITVE
jgi:plastocyanin